jgi:hypothetical protein
MNGIWKARLAEVSVLLPSIKSRCDPVREHMNTSTNFQMFLEYSVASVIVSLCQRTVFVFVE